MTNSGPIGSHSIYRTMFSFFWPGKRSLSRNVSEMLRTAEAVSLRALGQIEDVGPSGKFATDHLMVRKYEELFWDFARAAVICLGGRVGQDRELRLISGVISFIVGLASSYFIGKHWVQRSEAATEEGRVRQERTVRLMAFSQFDSSNSDMIAIKKILSLEEEIFNKIKRHAEYSLAVRIGLFVAALFGIAGAITGATSTMTVAAGVAVVTSIGWLIAEGFDFASGEQKRSAQKMQDTLENLRHRTSF
jgi:hypothetical protein